MSDVSSTIPTSSVDMNSPENMTIDQLAERRRDDDWAERIAAMVMEKVMEAQGPDLDKKQWEDFYAHLQDHINDPITHIRWLYLPARFRSRRNPWNWGVDLFHLLTEFCLRGPVCVPVSVPIPLKDWGLPYQKWNNFDIQQMIRLDQTTCVVLFDPIMIFDRIFREIYVEEWMPNYQAHMLRGTQRALGMVGLGNILEARAKMQEVLWNFMKSCDIYMESVVTLWNEFEEAMRVSRAYTPYGERKFSLALPSAWPVCRGCWALE